MLGLPESERISMIRSAVLIQSTHVTDRQTDRQTDGQNCSGIYTRYSILSILPRVKRKEKEKLKSRIQKKSSLKL